MMEYWAELHLNRENGRRRWRSLRWAVNVFWAVRFFLPSCLLLAWTYEMFLIYLLFFWTACSYIGRAFVSGTGIINRNTQFFICSLKCILVLNNNDVFLIKIICNKYNELLPQEPTNRAQQYKIPYSDPKCLILLTKCWHVGNISIFYQVF